MTQHFTKPSEGNAKRLGSPVNSVRNLQRKLSRQRRDDFEGTMARLGVGFKDAFRFLTVRSKQAKARAEAASAAKSARKRREAVARAAGPKVRANLSANHPDHGKTVPEHFAAKAARLAEAAEIIAAPIRRRRKAP